MAKKKQLKFKELTETQKSKLAEIYLSKEISWDDKESMLAKFTGVNARTARKWCADLGLTKPTEEISPQYENAKKKKIDKRKKRFLVTWAQNDTPVHEGLLSNMEKYANHIGAEIHVIAGRYQNPTSIFSTSSETWHSRVVPYLDANRHKPHKYLEVLSDIKIQPTAVNPMTGMESITGEASCLIGHTRQHMTTIPVLDGMAPKIIMTTGACTIPNYTDSKSGKKAEFHHILGFVIVEVEDKDIFHMRQVSADDDGNFIDLIYELKDGKIKKNSHCGALVMGDIHVGYHDNRIIDKTFDIMSHIKPEYVVLHDVLDFKAASHHGKHDIFHQYRLEVEGKNCVATEIENVMNFLERFKEHKTIIVRSNHDEHLDQWLVDDANLKSHKTPKNLLTYMKYGQLIMEGKAPKGILPYLIEERFPNFKALGVDEGFEVNGYQLGEHGHRSSNGARGSIVGFRKLNSKIVVGHYHSPSKLDGANAVGCSTVMKMGYNKGASSWLNSHVMIHKNSKSQHINFIHKKDGTVSFTTLI